MVYSIRRPAEAYMSIAESEQLEFLQENQKLGRVYLGT